MAELKAIEIIATVAAAFAILATTITTVVGLLIRQTLTNGGIKLRREDEIAIHTTLTEITNLKNDVDQVQQSMMQHITDRTAHL